MGGGGIQQHGFLVSFFHLFIHLLPSFIILHRVDLGFLFHNFPFYSPPPLPSPSHEADILLLIDRYHISVQSEAHNLRYDPYNHSRLGRMEEYCNNWSVRRGVIVTTPVQKQYFIQPKSSSLYPPPSICGLFCFVNLFGS